MTDDDRQAKLAAALRANLKRRKTAARPPAPTDAAHSAPPSDKEPKPR